MYSEQYQKMVEKLEPYRNTLVLDLFNVVKLVDVISDEEDIWWIYDNGRKTIKSSAVMDWIPLKGKIDDKDYEQLERIWNLNTTEAIKGMDNDPEIWPITKPEGISYALTYETYERYNCVMEKIQNRYKTETPLHFIKRLNRYNKESIKEYTQLERSYTKRAEEKFFKSEIGTFKRLVCTMRVLKRRIQAQEVFEGVHDLRHIFKEKDD